MFGFDRITANHEGLQRLPDHGIVQKAIAEGRVILTHDLDFGRIVALSHNRVPSVITFRLADMRAANINRHLDNILTQFTGKAVCLAGGVRRLAAKETAVAAQLSTRNVAVILEWEKTLS